ncbi:MAG: FtsX-like permease family protein, partial [Vicinamibacterales bacterium]
FAPGDEQPGAPPVVVLSHAFWQRWFGGDPNAVGSTLRLGDRPFTVIGVMPRAVYPGWPVNPARVTIDPAQREYWVPMPHTPQFDAQARAHVYGVLARLAPGETIAAAQAELAALATPDAADPHGATLVPLRDQFVNDARTPLVMLIGAALAVLLIACANLAAVQVIVLEARRDELGVRAAIGADRGRLARQLLTESMVLAAGSGVAGLLLARAALVRIPSLLPPTVPLMTPPELDARVALFGGGVALACGLFVSAWPVGRASAADPAPRGTAAAPRRAVYRALVVAQIAVTVPLVVAAALLAQSLWSVRGRDAGFAIDDVLVADLGLVGPRYDDPRAVVAFEDVALPRVRALPGARAAALAYDHPLEANWTNSYALEGDARGDGDVRAVAELRMVSPGYFDALDVHLIDGRLPTTRDDLDAPGVVVVNEAFARSAPVQPVIGRRLRSSPPRLTWGNVAPDEFEIIGVVADERFRGLEAPSEPAVYMTTRQFPQVGVSLLVRTTTDPLSLAAPVRAVMRDVDSRVTFSSPRRLADVLDEQLVTRRVTADVVSGFAGLALGLAALGLYGLLVVAVAGRRREFGVRLALGAEPASIARAIVGESLRDAAVGVGAGLVLAMAAGRLIRGLLVEVTPIDPVTLVVVAAGLLAIAVAAALIPAGRAAAIDPARALRPDQP